MGLFGFGKKQGVVDLGERYKMQQKKTAQKDSNVQASSPASSLGFLGSLASSSASNSQENSGYVNLTENDERKRKFSKMLMELSKRIEDLSNQIYHLKQRVELLEKKMNISFG